MNEAPNRITLPKLTALVSLESHILHLIHAPKLSYYTNIFGHLQHLTVDNYLYGFDFSKMTHLDISTDYSGFSYIAGTDQCGASEDIPRLPMINSIGVESIFDKLPTSYPYLFFLLFSDWHVHPDRPSALITALACLKRAFNLIQVTLNTAGILTSFETDMRSLLDPLRGSTTVRHLIILSGSSFRTMCNLLSEGDFCPCLEKLTFSADYFEGAEREPGYITDSLRVLMAGKTVTWLKPLEEVELKRFLPIPSQEIEEIKRLGLRLVQKDMQSGGGWFSL